MANAESQNNYDTAELEFSFNKNLHLRDHPEIGPYVTETYRVKYAGLLKTFLTKPSVKKNLYFMHMMSAPPNTNEQFVQNEADNVRSARDILNFQVAKAAGVFISEKDKDNLVTSLQNSFENDGLETEFIEAILNSFDGDLTCEEYVSVFANLHLLKSCGFSHDRMFFAILHDLRNSGDKEKTVELSARYYASILKSNDNFNSDSAREDFLKICKKYAAGASLHKPDENLVSEIGHTGVATLNSIRVNVLFNIKSFLSAEQKKDKLYCPLEVYALRDSFPTIKFTSKQVEKLAKAISQANKEPINLTKTFQGFQVLFNCFLCPSSLPSFGEESPSPHPSESQSYEDRLRAEDGASSSDRPAFQPPISFVDRVLGRFNVQRVEPRNSRAAVDAHFVNVHTCLTQGQTNDLNGHGYIFICPDCLHNNFFNAVICCAAHYESHNKILHSKTLTHFRVLTKLREVFIDDSPMLQVVDKYLLTICNFCKNLFPDKESRDIHTEKVCIPRYVSLSTYFGEPILSTPAFKSRSILEEEKRERVTHLVSCLKNISKHILKPGQQTVGTDPNFPPSTDRSTAATVGAPPDSARGKKLDLFSTLVLEETQMDINVFPSPRSPSPAPSNASVVSTEPAALSNRKSSATSTVPAVLEPSGSNANESNSKLKKAKDAPCKASASKQRQKETKTEKRRQFRLIEKEAIEDHRRDRSRKTQNANDYEKDDDDDDDDDDEDDNDDEGNNSPRNYDVDATENGIGDDDEGEPEGDDRNRMDVNKVRENREGNGKGQERMDDDRRDDEERPEEPVEERRTDGRREERGKKQLVERARSGERIVATTEGRRRYTPERERGQSSSRAAEERRGYTPERERGQSSGRAAEERRRYTPERERGQSGGRIAVERRRYTPDRERDQSRIAWRKSGGPSTKVKSSAARRRIQFDGEYDDEDESEEEPPIVVTRPRPRATARMHSSNVLRMSKPVKKKTAPRHYYFESDESRSPSPQSTPPSKRRKEVKVREVRPKKKRPRTYMVINSDSESN